jgi:type IV secretory pathway ATPase VirB11/archaellum biosynthesis ATPase
MSTAEQEELLEDVCNDVLGYGPLEPLLARDDIADIMVNGPNQVYIEVNGKVERPMSGSATTPSFSTSASASSARSAAGSTNRARSATRACPTARASTSSPRRWPSTAPRSPSASSRRTS